MDRFALEYNLRDASARIVACQEALLSQRFQVRELERCGLDASVARALLEIYEESKAMAISNRDSLANTLRTAAFTTTATSALAGPLAGPSAAPQADPLIDDLDDHEIFYDADFNHRLAA